jgi:hypothetical protein
MKSTCRAVFVSLLALGACGDETAVPSAVTLGTLQAQVFATSCAFSACHSGANPKGDLDLSSFEASAASLLNRKARDGETDLVAPGRPEASLLYQVLVGTADLPRMPLGFELPEASVTRVRDWIAQGAPLGAEGDTLSPIDPPDDEPVVDPNAPRPEDLAPPDPAEGFQMGIDTRAEAGSEIWKCLVADLPTTDLSPVNRVEAIQSPGVHHMDVMALGLLDLPIEPGLYDCDALYAQHAEMMEDGIFLFATQNQRESLTLPQGTVALIPAGLRVMVEIHYVNPLPRAAEVWSRINAYTIPIDAMEKQIWGSAVRTTDIDIPAQTDTHYEWVRCEMNTDIELILLSSHTHALARYVDVYRWDGEKRGELLYDNDDWHAPVLKQFPTPISIKAGEGFEFRCHYRNPTDTNVKWGFRAEDEMCQIGFVHTPFDMTAECIPTEIGRGPTLP